MSKAFAADGSEDLHRGEEYSPTPFLTAVSPASADEGDGDTVITVTGIGFLSSTTATFNGTDRDVTYNSATEIEIELLAADLDTAGIYSIVVSNPEPGWPDSVPWSFEVIAPDPDPYFSSVVSLLHFDGTNGSTTLTDQKGKTWTAQGGATIDTSQFKYGNASLNANAAARYADTASSADFGYGTADFTIEFWARYSTVTGIQVVYDQRPSGVVNAAVPCLVSGIVGAGQLSYFVSGATRIDSASSLSTNIWYHIAISRVSGTTRLFIDGVSQGTPWTDSTNYPSSESSVGTAHNSPGAADFAGWIDDLRITKGIGRYTSNFTPPNLPFPNS